MWKIQVFFGNRDSLVFVPGTRSENTMPEAREHLFREPWTSLARRKAMAR
jgi:hypothetical protein